MKTFKDLQKELNEEFDDPRIEQQASRAYGSFKMGERHGVIEDEHVFSTGHEIDIPDLNKEAAMAIVDEYDNVMEIQTYAHEHYQGRSKNGVDVMPLAFNVFVEGERTDERTIRRAVKKVLDRFDRDANYVVENGGGSYGGGRDGQAFGQTLVLIYPKL